MNQLRSLTTLASQKLNQKRQKRIRRKLQGFELLESRKLMAVSIGDYVWRDTNSDGIQNESVDLGVNDVAVKLYTSTGTLVQSTFTKYAIDDPDDPQNPGFYEFKNVDPGEYYVVFTLPPTCEQFTQQFASGSLESNDSNANANGRTNNFTVGATNDELSIDAGLIPAFACIGNQVWWDQTEDGIQDDIEPGIAGAKVKLLKSGVEIAERETNQAGQYAFTNLTAGNDYQVKFLYPAGFDRASPADQGTLENADSDGLGTDLVTANITITSNQFQRAVDQGFYRSVNVSTVGNYVWRDQNSDGLQNDGPASGVNGITVNLYNSNNVFQRSTTTGTDSSGNPGYYEFANVSLGTYYVVFVAPGEIFTLAEQSSDPNQIGDSVADSNGKSYLFFAGFDNDFTIDAGLLPKVDLSLTGGVSDQAPGLNSTVTYTLTISNAAGFSNASGISVADVIPAGLAYVSDNGGGSYNLTTRSWNVGNLNAGSSKTLQVTAKVVSGGTFTNIAQVQTASPSDIDSTPGNAATIHEDDDVSSTITASATIGDFVWRDANNNGVQDELDSFGINGIGVSLFTSAGGLVAQTTTTFKDGKPGYYSFPRITPGQYYVQFNAPSGQAFTSTGAGTLSTDSNADSSGRSPNFTVQSGLDDLSIDAGLKPIDLSLTSVVSDPTPQVGTQVTYTVTVSNASGLSSATGVAVSGVLPPGVTYFSDNGSGTYNTSTGVWTIGTVASGTSVSLMVTGVIASAGVKTALTQIALANQTDIDSTPGNATTANEDDGTTVTVTPSSTIGDYVWRDANNNGVRDEADSFGMNGVVVSLFTAAGAPVAQTTTNNKGGKPGYYSFPDINPGQYYVQFTAPLGQAFTSVGAGTSANDNDANSGGRTGNFELLSGVDQLDIDAGFRPIDLSLTSAVSDPTPMVGGLLTYTITVSNASNLSSAVSPTVSGILPAGVNYVSDDSSGLYNNSTGVWTIPLIAPGTSVSLVVQGRVASGGAKTAITQIASANQPDIDSTPNNAATIDEDDNARVTITPSASIGDYVWRDANNNGIQDEPDSFGINGVTVTLFNSSGGQVSQTMTATVGGKPGYYSFPDINPGQYYVQVTPPAGQAFTASGAGALEISSNVNQLGRTALFALASGVDNTTLDAGLRPIDLALAISANDLTPPINSTTVFTVTVSNAADLSRATGVSVADVLPPGFNYVSHVASGGAYDQVLDVWQFFDVPSGASATLTVTAAVASGGTTSTLAQVKTADQPDVDSVPNNAQIRAEDDSFLLTLTPSAKIGDYVWRDENNDGIQNEPATSGVNGVTVTLYGESGNQIATVLTANDSSNRPGYYSFTDINPGNYYVVFSSGAGQSFTTRFAGTANSDSNVDATGRSNTFTLSSGVDELSIDAGFSTQTCATLDWNGNTVTSGTVGNIRTVTVGSISAKASGFSRDRTTGAWEAAYLGAYGGGLGVTDSSEGTGDGDLHTVDNLGGRDNYVVFEFNQPIVLNTIDLGYVVGDSDLTVWIGTVPNAYNNHQMLSDSLLAGLYTEENLTDLTTARMADVNSLEIVGNFIVIAASTSDTSPEDRFKIGKLNLCTPGTQLPASLGDTVWHDLNGNGIREATEPGIAGASVTLTGGGSDGVINGVGDTSVTTLTSATGNYSFSGLVPGVQYRVSFATPSGFFAASPRLLGSDRAIDSDGLVSNIIILGSGQNDTSVDAGFYKEVKVGDFVWNDADQDGFQDSTELGFGSVALTLTGTSGDGSVINRSTTTAANGSYQFAGLPPGSYQVTVAASNFATNGVLSNYAAGPTLVGTNRASDSNTNPSATSPATLASGAVDPTVDFGFYLALTKVCTNVFLEGNTATSGTYGNILTVSSGSIAAKASAFSRDSAGKWETAYLGRYAGGMGVTDRSEGTGSGNTHTVDNLTRNNYILFEFSQAVTIDSAFLGFVSGDSDIQVWIGYANNAFNSHYPLSDDFLAGMTLTEVNLGGSTTRTADINAGNISGNILVISAVIGEANDQLKVAELALCAQVPIANAWTKYFTVDDDSHKTYQYGTLGESRQEFAVAPTTPRGITTNVSGSNVWIADYSGRIYNYTSSGVHVANWSSKISGLQGITTDGTNIWTVSESTDTVYYYPSATTYGNGTTVAPKSWFALNYYNSNPTGITTDGTYIWVVNEGNVAGGVGDMVFKYTKSGSYLGRWQLDAANGRPTGITVDPSGGNRLWVVDNGTDRIYEYVGATGLTSGGLIAAKSYALAAGNGNAQDIADPPSFDGGAEAIESSLAVNEQFINPAVNPYNNSFNATDVNSDGTTSPADALAVINRLSAIRRGEKLPKDRWFYDDVSNDGILSPLDALLVINYLSSDRTSTPTLPPEVMPGEPVSGGTTLASGEQSALNGSNGVDEDLSGEGEQAVDYFFANYDWQLPSATSNDEFGSGRRKLARLR